MFVVASTAKIALLWALALFLWAVRFSKSDVRILTAHTRTISATRPLGDSR